MFFSLIFGQAISVDNSDTAIDIEVAGTMVIGGINGFSAVIAAAVDPVNKNISIKVTHEGDWQPFECLPFTSPRFEGALTLESGGSFSFGALVETPTNIAFFGLIYPANADANPMFSIHLSRIGNSGTSSLRASLGTSAMLDLIPKVLILKGFSADIDVVGGSADFTASGMAELTTGSNGPLVLQVAGTASTSGDISLDVSTTELYVPLPKILPKFKMPHLTGSFSADAVDGRRSMSVTAEAVSFSLANVLQFDDWTGTISVDNSDTAVDPLSNGDMIYLRNIDYGTYLGMCGKIGPMCGPTKHLVLVFPGKSSHTNW